MTQEPDDDFQEVKQVNCAKFFTGIFTKGTDSCILLFARKYDECYENVTEYLGWLLCWPFKLSFLCDLIGSKSKQFDLSLRLII